MAYVLTDDKHYKDIGRAIQRKLGVIDNFYPEDMADAILSIPSGGGDIDQYRTFVQMNDVAAAFLADTTYQNQTYDDTDLSAINFTTSVMESTYRSAAEAAADRNPSVRGDECLPVTLSLNSAGNLTVTDGSKHIVTFEGLSAGDTKLHNVTPFEVDTYSNINSSTGQVTQCGSLSGTGQLRMIHTTSGNDATTHNYNSANVRDLGGWTCDNGYIKYGKIFRGCKFNGFSDSSIHISDHDLHTFNDLLNIRSEIDLRSDEDLIGVTGSAFGPQVAWHSIPVESYQNGLENSAENYCEIFKQIAYDIVRNNPIYIHCNNGEDQTGTVCALLEGLLGVARYDIDKDYELSSLVNYKNRIGAQSGTVTSAYNAFRNSTASSSWKEFIHYISDTYGGPTFRDKVIGYLSESGVTLDEINLIRQNLIEGTPTNITPYNVTYTLSHVTASNNITQVTPYQVMSDFFEVETGYDITTTQILMNNVDVTSEYMMGTTSLLIPEVIGDVEITILATPRQYAVSHNVTNAIFQGSNLATYGQAYHAAITPEDGYEISVSDVTVRMRNLPVSSAVTISDQGEAIIAVSNVTGTISITATATPTQV